MAGSLKDALKRTGHLPTETATPPAAEPTHQQWLDDLPEPDARPHVPFDAPARAKVIEKPKHR